MTSKEAPLFSQCLGIAGWALEQFSLAGPLSDRVHRHTLDLLEAVVLALRGFEREEQVERADRSLALLRVHLRLALDTRVLSERSFLAIARRLDEIGRQIGGWQRRLSSGIVGERRR